MMDIRTTTCPMCLNGCQVGIGFDGYQYRIEYLGDVPPNNGRLCPRGNSANIVIDHPKRLCYPLLDGKEVGWDKAYELMRRWAKEVKPDEAAVVYSRGVGGKELGLVWALASAIGTENLICGYLEPDNFFQFRLEGVKAATLDDLSSARATLLIGDVFNTSPVAAKKIIEARYADKANRLVVIDSIKTRQAGFAHIFVQPHPGTEYLVLLGIAGLLDEKLKIDIDGITRASGVTRSQIQEVANVIKANGNGVVACSACLGRVSEPFWHSLSAQLVALKANKPFVGFGEALVPEGKLSFDKFRDLVLSEKVRLIFWFGGLYPYSYPELLPELQKIEFRVATSIFRPAEPLSGVVLPVPSELEREGVRETLWGEMKFQPVAKPVSGTKPLAEIVRQFGVEKGLGPERKFTVVKLEEVIEGLMQNSEFRIQNSENPSFLLVGRKEAFGVGGFFDSEEEIWMNTLDGQSLNVQDNDLVLVKSKTGEEKFKVKLNSAVPQGVVSVGVNTHKNRRLFPVEFDPDSGNAKIPPTRVEIWRAQL